MSSSKNGIHVPYRVIFIMVIVSICINIFFLLMGILIGKDDNKWEATQQNAVEEITEDPPVRATSLEDELSQFERQEDRRDPITPLETVVEDQPIQVQPVDPEPKPIKKPVETVKKDPPPQKAEPAKPEPAPPKITQSKPLDPGFYIQVLASKDRSKTDSFLSRVKKAGYSAQVIQEGGYYKILVGSYATRAPANKDKDKLNKEFKINAWVRAR